MARLATRKWMHRVTCCEAMFDAAIKAAQPALCLPPHLPAQPKGRLDRDRRGQGVGGYGQRRSRTNWSGALTGLVVTRYGYAVPCERIEIIESAHPVPDAASIIAARRILDTVSDLCADDLVSVPDLSGGGSSLLVTPLEGLTLEDKQSVNRALLKSGASISEMNCVRRHLSAVKGGRLAAACYPAKVVTLSFPTCLAIGRWTSAPGPTVRRPDHLRRRARASSSATASTFLRTSGSAHERRGRERQAGRLAPGGQRARFVATPQMALEAAANGRARCGRADAHPR